MSDDLQPAAASSMSQPDQLELMRIALNLVGQELGILSDKIENDHITLNVLCEHQLKIEERCTARLKAIEEKLDEVLITVDRLSRKRAK